MHFSLSDQTLNPIQLAECLASDECGALATFAGTVRNRNLDREVTALEYEAYADLCAVEMERLFEEVRSRFAIADVRVCHRTGRLAVGETAVWIGVTAGHRAAAFDACRYLIDELKQRLPIWKKEYYRDGDSGWIGCAPEAGTVPPAADTLEKDVRQLSARQLSEAVLVDVREPIERMMAPLSGIDCLEIPYGSFPCEEELFRDGREYLLFCAQGIRSLQAVRLLREAGIRNAYSLNNTFGEIKAAVNAPR
ncbi:MAG: molybdenum cofactor biosynthesis protein MoaE [Candidatus Omnitrophica bacterium]|nr:molybdenum cofactor biosynthesis protein MoaE [Candidatus Omnitrophota bacterium]